MNTSLRQFVDTRLYRIKGFMHPADAVIFASILDFQNKQNMGGSAAEIGVFFGRSFALMALNAKSRGEKAIGIDLFDIPGQRSYVESILEKEKLTDASVLRAANSQDITGEQFVSEYGKLRFFSIDGGHELHHIENDTTIAIKALAPHGVIAFDDFLNSQYPDLSVGIIDALRSHKDSLVPFCISKAKLYVTSPEYQKSYFDFMQSTPLWGNVKREVFTFLGTNVVHCTQSVLDRAIYQKFAGAGLGSLGDKLSITPKSRASRQ